MSPDPVIEAIIKANAGRKPGLLRIKYRRMAADAFAFFRGTDHLFGRAWPELKPADLGPAILICGDLHLENFGAYRTDQGDLRFGINDFDEAIVARCSLDLVRCATSIFLAAEHWNLTPTQASGMALAFLDQFREAVVQAVEKDQIGEVAPTSGHGAIWDLLGRTASASQRTLLDQVTRRKRSGRREIRRVWNHPEIGPRRAKVVRKAITDYAQSTPDGGSLRVLDLTGRIAGVGSLGVRRYLALVGDGEHDDDDRVLDVKECGPPSLLSCTDAPQPDFGGNDALRVVSAQTTLQGHRAAGLGVLSITDRPYRVREMIPEENRASLDRLRKQPTRLREAVESAGRLTAWSHLRGCKVEDQDRSSDLALWASGSALDALLASAARFADRTNRDYAVFLRESLAGRVGSP